MLETSVLDLGLKNDGVTDNTTALNNAIKLMAEAGGGTLFFPPGVYAIGIEIALQSGVSLVGAAPGNLSTLRLLLGKGMTGNILDGNQVQDLEIANLVINANAQPTTGGNFSVISLGGATRVTVRDCTIFGWDKFGIGIGRSQSCRIVRNTITRFGQSSPLQNQGISASGTNEDLLIADNELNWSGMDLTIARSHVRGNVIQGFGFGAGITTEQDPNCHDNVIEGNTVYGGTGIDTNQTRCLGIEQWDCHSIISGNLVFGNAGDGIDIGGQDCLVSGNIVRDNGVGSKSYSGIVARSGTPQYSAAGSAFLGNKSFNTLGPAGSQAYGFVAQGGVTRIASFGNDYFGNNAGVWLLNGTQVSGGF